MQVNLRAVTSSLASVGNTSSSIRLSPLLVNTSLAFVGNTSSSMSACADFGHPTHPGPHRFSHPAKSKFFSFLSDSEGNGKKLDLPPRPKGVAGALKSPKQKPLKNPSTAQIRRKSAANSRKSAQIRPPFCNSAPFRPTRPLRKTMKIANPSGRQYPP